MKTIIDTNGNKVIDDTNSPDGFCEERKICFEELVSTYLILEKLDSKTKEKGQRAVWKDYIDPFYKLRNYLMEKWYKKQSPKDMKQKKLEYTRFNELLKTADKIAEQSSPDAVEYAKEIAGKKLNWQVMSGEDIYDASDQSGIAIRKDNIPVVVLGKPNFKPDQKIFAGGIFFDHSGKEMKEIIKAFITMHEYGHLYEWLKEVVETGESEIVPTMLQDANKVANSEGKANAYALDNMYRKDRRELLKNSGLKMKDFEDSENKLSQEHYKSDEYKAGTRRHSKTLKRTLDSLKEEANYFPY